MVTYSHRYRVIYSYVVWEVMKSAESRQSLWWGLRKIDAKPREVAAGRAPWAMDRPMLTQMNRADALFCGAAVIRHYRLLHAVTPHVVLSRGTQDLELQKSCVDAGVRVCHWNQLSEVLPSIDDGRRLRFCKKELCLFLMWISIERKPLMQDIHFEM